MTISNAEVINIIQDWLDQYFDEILQQEIFDYRTKLIGFAKEDRLQLANTFSLGLETKVGSRLEKIKARLPRQILLNLPSLKSKLAKKLTQWIKNSEDENVFDIFREFVTQEKANNRLAKIKPALSIIDSYSDDAIKFFSADLKQGFYLKNRVAFFNEAKKESQKKWEEFAVSVHKQTGCYEGFLDAKMRLSWIVMFTYIFYVIHLILTHEPHDTKPGAFSALILFGFLIPGFIVKLSSTVFKPDVTSLKDNLNESIATFVGEKNKPFVEKSNEMKLVSEEPKKEPLQSYFSDKKDEKLVTDEPRTNIPPANTELTQYPDSNLKKRRETKTQAATESKTEIKTEAELYQGLISNNPTVNSPWLVQLHKGRQTSNKLNLWIDTRSIDKLDPLLHGSLLKSFQNIAESGRLIGIKSVGQQGIKPSLFIRKNDKGQIEEIYTHKLKRHGDERIFCREVKILGAKNQVIARVLIPSFFVQHAHKKQLVLKGPKL